MHICNASSQAVILTSFMKMCRGAPASTKAQIREVFEANKNHWDIELQQRSCEYLQMMEVMNNGGESLSLIENAIEKMPSFSQEIQTNNVLTKRIMALKNKDKLTNEMKQ